MRPKVAMLCNVMDYSNIGFATASNKAVWFAKARIKAVSFDNATKLFELSL